MKQVVKLEETDSVYSVKAATSPIYNLIKPSQDDFYNVDDFNHNTDIIEGELDKQSKQITDCNVEIEKVRGEIGTAIGSIDLSSVNSHTTSVGENTKSHVATQVTGARDNTNNHITSQHTTTKSHMTSCRDSINSTVNSARDNVKSHITTEKNNIVNEVKVNGGISGKTPYAKKAVSTSLVSGEQSGVGTKILYGKLYNRTGSGFISIRQLNYNSGGGANATSYTITAYMYIKIDGVLVNFDNMPSTNAGNPPVEFSYKSSIEIGVSLEIKVVTGSWANGRVENANLVVIDYY